MGPWAPACRLSLRSLAAPGRLTSHGRCALLRPVPRRSSDRATNSGQSSMGHFCSRIPEARLVEEHSFRLTSTPDRDGGKNRPGPLPPFTHQSLDTSPKRLDAGSRVRSRRPPRRSRRSMPSAAARRAPSRAPTRRPPLAPPLGPLPFAPPRGQAREGAGGRGGTSRPRAMPGPGYDTRGFEAARLLKRALARGRSSLSAALRKMRSDS